MLKSILTMTVVAIVGLSSVACTTTEQTVAGYGVGGAALGALAGTAISGSSSGAVPGAAIGAIAGTVTGAAAAQKKQKTPQQVPLCTYRDVRGQLYQAPCPQPVPQLCTYRDARGQLYQAPCPQPVQPY
ncbi:glycine zipper domain-containing protein [Bartonella schoenbuchensis]|uniref:glycine zipper domain-containing protein n=1 Tax=Bartonella schoenbuchensis TaxID=165694 RepID=UPI00314551BE